MVVVTNQVTTSFSSSSRIQGGRGQGIASHTNSSSRAGASAFETEVSGGQGNSYIIPALGNTWHHCVSNRVSEGWTGFFALYLNFPDEREALQFFDVLPANRVEVAVDLQST